jgi:hypothetical protein
MWFLWSHTLRVLLHLGLPSSSICPSQYVLRTVLFNTRGGYQSFWESSFKEDDYTDSGISIGSLGNRVLVLLVPLFGKDNNISIFTVVLGTSTTGDRYGQKISAPTE